MHPVGFLYAIPNPSDDFKDDEHRHFRLCDLDNGALVMAAPLMKAAVEIKTHRRLLKRFDWFVLLDSIGRERERERRG